VTTSGTVGRTVIDSAALLEHVFRRCRIKPAQQTPELVATAKESLTMLLPFLATRGLNLWCVEPVYVGLAENQAAYDLPAGTIDVLNVTYSQPTRTTGTDTTAATSIVTELTASTTILRIGIKVSAVSASDTLTLASSADGVTYTTITTSTRTDWETGEWYWFNLDPTVDNLYFRASFGSAATFSEFYLANAVYDLPVTQWNRDTYTVMNNKFQTGRPSTTYFYEKKVVQRITLWPVPNNDYDHMTVYRQREVQDVGTLQQTLEIPSRWYDPIVWQLATRVAFECDLVDPKLIQVIAQMATESMLQVEDDETDGAPIYLQPNVRGYSA